MDAEGAGTGEWEEVHVGLDYSRLLGMGSARVPGVEPLDIHAAAHKFMKLECFVHRSDVPLADDVIGIHEQHETAPARTDASVPVLSCECLRRTLYKSQIQTIAPGLQPAWKVSSGCIDKNDLERPRDLPDQRLDCLCEICVVLARDDHTHDWCRGRAGESFWVFSHSVGWMLAAAQSP